jgi:hypothetical protein
MTDFLFAQDSFLFGVARSLDLGGVFDDYNDSVNVHEADRRAAASDWQAVGRDIQFGIDAFSKVA